jgi:hypothetical protein
MKIINLLPKIEQKYIAQEKLAVAFGKFLAISAVSYAIIIAGLIGWRVFLQNTLDNVDTDIKTKQAIIDREGNDQIRKEVIKENAAISDYLNFAKTNPQWSTVMTAFSKLVPSDIIITSLNANTKTGKIDLLGVGLTRDAVLALRSNIVNSPLFKDINLPLENLQKANNVTFSYSFYLKQ